MMVSFPSKKLNLQFTIVLLLISLSTVSLADERQKFITEKLYQYLEYKITEDIFFGSKSYNFNLQVSLTVASKTATIQTVKLADSLIKQRAFLLWYKLGSWLKNKKTNIDNIQININLKEPFTNSMDAWRFNLRADSYKFLTSQGYDPSLIKVFIFPSASTEAIENNNFILVKPLSKLGGFVIKNLASLISASMLGLGIVLFLLLSYRKKKTKQNNKVKNTSGKIIRPDYEYKKSNQEEHLQNNSLFGTMVKNHADSYSDVDLDLAPEIKSIEQVENEEILRQLVNLSEVIYQLILKESIENPNFLSCLDDHWFSINHESEKYHRELNLAKQAVLYKIIGKQNLVNNLSHLRQRDLVDIARITAELENDLDYKNEIYELVVEDIKFLESQPEPPDALQCPFNFLLTMQNNLVVSLLRNKKQHIQAIALAQFETERCEQLCSQLFDTSEISHIEMEITYYKTIKSHHFQNVVNYLSSAAVQLILKELTVPLDSSMANKHAQPEADSQRAFDDQMRQQNLSLSSQISWTEEEKVKDEGIEAADYVTFLDIDNREKRTATSTSNDEVSKERENSWFDFGGTHPKSANKSDV